MIVDRTHIAWGLATAAATAGVTLVYLANNDPDTLQEWHLAFALPGWMGPVPPLRSNVGATPLGLIYGTGALLIFIFAALLGWRRNHPGWRVGRIQFWLKAHIWLTIFTLPLVAYHCGFHGGGTMTQFLLWLYAFVMASGFWGLALQQVIPRLMHFYLPEETIFEQIPYMREQLGLGAEAIREEFANQPDVALSRIEHAANTTAVLGHEAAMVSLCLAFIDQETLPYLRATKTRKLALRDKQTSDDRFRLLKLQITSHEQSALARLQALCDEKRQLDLQARFHYWLHGWLVVHAPASILLIVVTLVHAVVAMYLYA
jgi:hypothetical protein